MLELISSNNRTICGKINFFFFLIFCDGVVWSFLMFCVVSMWSCGLAKLGCSWCQDVRVNISSYNLDSRLVNDKHFLQNSFCCAMGRALCSSFSLGGLTDYSLSLALLVHDDAGELFVLLCPILSCPFLTRVDSQSSFFSLHPCVLEAKYKKVCVSGKEIGFCSQRLLRS